MGGRVYPFSDIEGLRIAAEMEKRGGAFYARAARVSASLSARELLQRLASDEASHEREFNRLHERALALGGDEAAEYDAETNAYLTALAADIVFPDGLAGLSRDGGLDSPAAILSTAIGSERDSIAFYERMITVARDEAARRAFGDIVSQERAHLMKLEAMKGAM